MSSPDRTDPPDRRSAPDRTTLPGRRRHLLVLLGVLAALLVVLALGYRLFGHALIAWRLEAGPSAEGGNLADEKYALLLEKELRLADEKYAAALAIGVALWVLVGLLGLLWLRRARVPLWLAAVVLWWIGVELVVAPYLVRPLRLVTYNVVQDPDHRPPRPAQPVPGWNSDAIRATPEPEAFAAGDLNLIFLGDSFTYGMRIQDPAQTFAERVEAALAERFPGRGVRVANFGWTSSSPYLSLRRLRDDGERYRPALVALFVDLTDFHDDVKWEGMVERRGIYRFYDKLPLTLRMLESWAPGLYWRWWRASNDGLPRERYFVTEAPLEETRAWMEPLARNVAAIDAWCDERGIPFVLFALPRYHQYSDVECPEDYELDMPGRAHSILGPHVLEPFRFFEELAGRGDYPVRSLLEDFRTTDVHPHCFPDDPHWNPAGHAIAARAIARELEALVLELGLADG